VIILKNPAHRHATKPELARVLSEIAGVVLVLIPERLSGHPRFGLGTLLVPGFPVGAGPGNVFTGGGDGRGAGCEGAMGCVGGVLGLGVLLLIGNLSLPYV